MRVELILERQVVRRLNSDAAKKQLRRIASVVERNNSLKLKGRWSWVTEEPTVVLDSKTQVEMYSYKARIKIMKSADSAPESAKRHLARGEYLVKKRATQLGWKIEGVASSKPNEVATTKPLVISRPPFVVPELNNYAMNTICRGIYDRESHVRIIHDGVVDFFDTLAKHQDDASIEVSRPHVLLKGPPAGAKTSLFERLKVWYEGGRDVPRVTFVDATTASKAGLENWLLSKAEDGELTEIIVLEEIEKQPLDNLLTLVSLMGSGYIAKLNARIGFRKELAQVLVWATCNQEEIIQKFRNGVLWSRFANKLHCTRPSRERMHQILLDKIRQRGGNVRWADAAIEFAYEIIPEEFGNPMDDPRDVIALLAGRNRLLDRSYQEDRLIIMRAEAEEKIAADAAALVESNLVS